ncbi:LCP family protein [Agromyces albus]|uniref:LytR family transcriptional regulator n=1 Tax=Agromyces albus TaxID=205332 RepID=A0A4Q2L8T7_9MICO|nr:LCP family protein [Agromyces albus]RXZ72801.1 LytR family transcriptional regulator [Agromyces albus]
MSGGSEQASVVDEQVSIADSADVPRHGRLPRHDAARAYLKLAASVVAVLAVSAGSVAAFAVIDLVGSVKPPVELESEEMLEGVPDIGAMEGGLSFILVGSDKRPDDGAFGDPEEESAVLNDVTMLLHISQDHSHVEVVSFPRDLVVEVPECTDPENPEGEPLPAMSGVKLNTVLSHGGLGCVGTTVEQLTGVQIPLGGIVEFYGVAALSEAVGGVEVCLAEPVVDEYSGLNLDAGRHSISGMEALAFLRSRHGVGDGSDLGRISNQQTFLASLMRTLQSEGTLGDPVKLYSIAKAVLSNMTLSTALQDPTRLVAIARMMQDVDLSKVAFVQYPTVYTEDFASVEPSESAAIVNAALQADRPVQFDPNAIAGAEFGTVEDPTAPPPAEEAPASEAPTDPPAEAGAPPEPLPGDVTGQTAAEVRCASANEG